MPRKYRQVHRKMEETNDLIDDVTVVDVYDIASDIGKECEKIIDLYGADAVTSLMPKVISALELLENLAVNNERENSELLELKSKISQLENDKIEKAEYRQKFEKELEAIEEQWRAESKELLALVSRLQDENRKLAKVRGTSQVAERVSPTEIVNNSDMLQKLQLTLEKQRDEIRVKEKLLQEKCGDMEKMRSQVDRLTNSGRELRRKHKTLQNQVRTLCDERADFLVQLQDQQRDITALRQRLGLAEKENEDLAKSDVSYPSNKAVYDLDDPNRPRFTTAELKDILHERNELKARVSDLEDELETYRPKNATESKFKLVEAPVKPIPEPLTPLDEDAPVQGPLPYEPEDAPWKRTTSESGIRKFFRKLFSEGGGGGSSFPRRSLSTLTKMALSATDEPIPV
ncbi:hypothetical protein PPYR_03534 [Photinus pyralis]|uniref:RH1 domain-containing protein n=2 Tax=Photinus pyralis TaxID=7054 RepID=A0A1Y1KQD7_PHOPY|nr:RILP-like protein homolog isoform X1 [Photinus pyralis]KAB0791734.1 hypothetical protein PPYR_03534 [Photinus pyralis]